jgi:hypothetical protein
MHTTLADYVESRLEAQPAQLSDQLREMANIEDAMSFIEEHFAPGQDVTEQGVGVRQKPLGQYSPVLA